MVPDRYPDAFRYRDSNGHATNPDTHPDAIGDGDGYQHATDCDADRHRDAEPVSVASRTSASRRQRQAPSSH